MLIQTWKTGRCGRYLRHLLQPLEHCGSPATNGREATEPWRQRQAPEQWEFSDGAWAGMALFRGRTARERLARQS